MRKRLQSLYERVASRVARKMFPSALFLEGHVYVETADGSEVYLGQNVVTEQMRIAVAGLLARPNAAGVDYLGDTGYDSSDPVFPVALLVGHGTDPAVTTDTLTEFSPYELNGNRVEYPLKRILFYGNPVSYGTDPIQVAFFFDIPQGEVYEDPVSGDPSDDVMIEEWGMVDGQDRLLTRKVTSFSKLPNLALTVRWEIRT